MSRVGLVAIGASWGGLRAVEAVLGALAPDFAAPIVIAQHRQAASTDEMLVRLLNGRCDLTVCEAEDKQALEPGVVLVAPPDYHLLVEAGGMVALSVDAPLNYSRPSIDILLHSAADAYGERVAGVVLTGANADGALGLAQIAARGGTAIVQDPETAERREMPDAALWAVPEARVLALEEIGPALTALAGDAHGVGLVNSDTAILLVDDRDENLLALEAILEPTGYRLVKARSGDEALKAVLQADFAAILLDVQMPGLDGFQTAELIRTRERTRGVPIIFVTAISKAPENVFRGYEAGAVDYLFKPVDAVVLRSKVEVFGELYERGRALVEREELLRATFEDAPIGMARAGSDGRLAHVNRALTQTIGRDAAELLGRTLDELGPRADAGIDADQREALLAGRILRYEVERRLTGPRGTTIPVLVSASLARPSNGARPDLILQLQDLRERRRAQRDREQLIRAQAARAQAETAAERLRIMQSIAIAALGAEDLEGLLRELLDRILEALDVDRAAVVLTDEARAVVARAAGGVDTVVARQARDHIDDLVERVVREDGPLAIADIAEDGLDASSLGPAVSSLLAVPLSDGARVIGSIHVGTLTRRDFDDETIGLLRLAADRAGLAIAHTRLHERERGIAQELQRSLLPKRLPRVPGVALEARYLPGVDGTTVGGDWYDAVALPSGRVALAIGDVVGRGITAAATMGQMRSALRAILMQADDTGAMADRLNRFAHTLAPESVMTTVVLAILEPATGTLRYTSAGHPPPLVVSPDGSARFLAETPSPPMGVLASPRYPEHAIVLEPGSTFILYTDGLVEAPTEVLDVGLARLMKAARNAGANVAATCDRLLEQCLSGSEARSDDDVTVLVVRMEETLGPRVALEVSGLSGGLFAMRQTLRRWLGETSADEDETEDVIMACNEACENSIEHGYKFGDDLFDVVFERAGQEVTISVRDRGNWQPPHDEPHRGHGLPLIGKLMDAVEVLQRTGGTTVLMRRRLGTAPRPPV